jgi:hypothetical protein
MDAAEELHRDRIGDQVERRLRVFQHRLSQQESFGLDHDDSMIERAAA